jgi:hypothetical protein
LSATQLGVDRYSLSKFRHRNKESAADLRELTYKRYFRSVLSPVKGFLERRNHCAQFCALFEYKSVVFNGSPDHAMVVG